MEAFKKHCKNKQHTLQLAIALLSFGSADQAISANCPSTISTAVTASCSLQSSASLQVAGTGSMITNSVPSVQVNGVTANTINNQGLIKNIGSLFSSAAIHVTDGATLTGGIINSGTISLNFVSGYGSAIQVKNGAEISGDISNSGTIQVIGGISTSNVGIGVHDGGIISGNIVNSGHIQSGIWVWGGAGPGALAGEISGDIINTNLGNIDQIIVGLYGPAKITGDISNAGTIGGIYALGSTSGGKGISSGFIEGNITNHGVISNGVVGIIKGDLTNDNGGTISATSPFNFYSTTVAGVNLNNGGVIGRLVNNGTITASSGSSGSLFYAGVNVINAQITDVISNTGVISGYGSIYGTGLAVAGAGGSASIADVSNTGTILGSVTGSGIAVGIAVWVGSEINGSINNSGTIKGDSAQGIGIGIRVGVVGDGNENIVGGISNSGLIVGVGSTGGYGIRVDTGAISGGIINTGTIAGASGALFAHNTSITLTNSGVLDGEILVGGNSVLNISGGSLINGNATSSGVNSVVHVAGLTNVSGYKTADFIGFDSFSVDNGGTLSFADGDILKPGTTIDSNGSIEVLTNSVGTIDNNYSQSSLGVLEIDLTSITNHGQLVVNGNASFSAGAGIYIDTQAGSNLIIGETFTILMSSSLSASTFNVADDTYAFDFVASTMANNIVVTVVKDLSPIPYNDATKGVAGAIEIIRDGDGVDVALKALLDEILSLPSDQIPSALEELLPTLAGAGLNILPTIGGAMSGVIDAASGVSGSSSGDSTPNDKFVWMKPFVVNVNQGTQNSVPGYDANISGFLFGADDQLLNDIRAGWSLGYANTEMSGNDGFNGQSLDIDTYQLGLYAKKEFEGASYATGKFQFGWNNNESKREITGSGAAKADYDSWYTLLNAVFGKELSIGENLALIPELSINYVYMNQENYSEHGSPAALEVDSQDADSLVFAVGSKLHFRVEESKSIIAKLELGYDALSDGVDLSSTFVGGGQKFKTSGSNPDRIIVRGGFGLNLMEAEEINISINYDTTWRDQYTDQSVSATLHCKW
jgi:outer membrane autotransporter protein